MAYQGFLVGELVSLFWWVELDFFSLECNEVSVVSFGASIGLAWLWEAHLLMFNVVFLFCWRISMVCLALEIVGSLGGA